MFEHLTLPDQLERIKRWRDPISFTCAATVLYRVPAGLTQPPLDKLEFLVQRRLKGAAMGFVQTHHGGYVDPRKDENDKAAAMREAKEETGFILMPQDLLFCGRIGPWLNKSTMRMSEDSRHVELTILNEPAEPNTPFTLSLFVADVTYRERTEERDGEAEEVGWFRVEKIVEQYGQSKQWAYPSMFMAALKAMFTSPELFPSSRPGTESFRIW